MFGATRTIFYWKSMNLFKAKPLEILIAKEITAE